VILFFVIIFVSTNLLVVQTAHKYW